MLDALEAGIAELQSRNGRSEDPVAPSRLQEELERARVSPADFANLLGLRPNEIDEWLEGRTSIPPWLPAVVRAVGLLPPSARRKLLPGYRWNTGAGWKRPVRTHPFSRIEEL